MSKISKIETGKATLRPAEVRTLLDRYGVTERDVVLRLARDARRRSTHPGARVGQDVRRHESRRRRKSVLMKPKLVPGLLQTEDYARVVTQAAEPTRDPREVERLVATRMERQQRLLHSDHTPLIWAILNEAVIRRQAGDKETIGPG